VDYQDKCSCLKKANVEINRKALAEMAVKDPASFSKLLTLASAKLES
jgi:ribosomal protein L20